MFISLVTLIGNTNAEDKIKISGKINFSDYQNGAITIIVRREVSGEPAFVKTIPRPGGYTIEIPQNLGFVYISAVNLKEGATKQSGDTPLGEFRGNPIYVGDEDIKDIDIVITKPSPKPKPILMDSYNGPTVTITGRVIFDNYKEGKISVFARSEGYRGTPDISVMKIATPGIYALKVPKNFDKKIEIMAVNIKEGMPPSPDNPKGRYSNNPIKIGSSDIKNVDIIIKP